MNLLLASSSPYRKRLLARLQIPFETRSPEIDEMPRAHEHPMTLAARLAAEKAAAIAGTHPGATVIGSDQVASLDGVPLGKPGNAANARSQLRASSGRSVVFYTGLAVQPANGAPALVHVEPFTVHFRALTDTQIADYVHREQPLDCAGSFKWESLGIALFTSLQGEDPTSLEGLPLISLVRMLGEVGVPVLRQH